MKKIILGLMLICLTVTGCRERQEVVAIPQETLSASSEAKSVLANSDHVVKVGDLKQKYGTSSENNIMPLYNISPHDSFTFQFKSNLNTLRGSSEEFPTRFSVAEQAVTVHTDREAQPESSIITFNVLSDDFNDDSGTSQLEVQPIGPGALAVLDDFGREDLWEKGGGIWGNAPVYYIRVNYDLDAATPTKLEKPIIIPFTVASDLPAPDLRYEIDAEGRFKLVWDKVKGAESYHIYNSSSINNNEPIAGSKEGYRGAVSTLVCSTTATEFNDFGCDGKSGLLAGDEWVIIQNEKVIGNYYVTAVAGDKESLFSNPAQTSPLSKQLPVKLSDWDTMKSYETIDKLPKTIPVTFIDGSVSDLSVSYEGIMDEGAAKTKVYLDYKIKGTKLKGSVAVNKATSKEIGLLQSDSFQASEPNSGNISPQITRRFLPGSDVPTIIEDSHTGGESDFIARQRENTRIIVAKADEESVKIPDVLYDVPLNADSALEEYLALNLAGAKEDISLRAFPQAQNAEILFDVLEKVIYQNPLILGVDSYGYDYKGLTLYIEYEDSSKLINKKQQQMVKEARSIVSAVIREGMNDEQKGLALYDYLNDNATYDQLALDSAAANNYKSADAKFNDSFTTYGVLVNKRGVCGSYAQTYKLLSDLAELENVVVTGTLQNVSHAWNKIRINDQWVNVDATNNETNSGVPYFLYGSSDKMAESLTYSEDNRYWLDSELSNYAVNNNVYDYYVTHDLTVQSLDAFKSKLSALLETHAPIINLRISGVNVDDLLDETAQIYEDIAPDLMDTAEYFTLGSYFIIH